MSKRTSSFPDENLSSQKISRVGPGKEALVTVTTAPAVAIPTTVTNTMPQIIQDNVRLFLHGIKPVVTDIVASYLDLESLLHLSMTCKQMREMLLKRDRALELARLYKGTVADFQLMAQGITDLRITRYMTMPRYKDAGVKIGDECILVETPSVWEKSIIKSSRKGTELIEKDAITMCLLRDLLLPMLQSKLMTDEELTRHVRCFVTMHFYSIYFQYDTRETLPLLRDIATYAAARIRDRQLGFYHVMGFAAIVPDDTFRFIGNDGPGVNLRNSELTRVIYIAQVASNSGVRDSCIAELRNYEASVLNRQLLLLATVNNPEFFAAEYVRLKQCVPLSVLVAFCAACGTPEMFAYMISVHASSTIIKDAMWIYEDACQDSDIVRLATEMIVFTSCPGAPERGTNTSDLRKVHDDAYARLKEAASANQLK